MQFNLRPVLIFILFSVKVVNAQHKLLLDTNKFFDTNTYQRFEIVDVIDARADKLNIGIIFNPATEKSDSITTDKSLKEALIPYFDRCGNKSEKQIQLYLKVNFLQFGYRKIKNCEYVWAFCDYSIVKKKDDVFYLLKTEVCAVEGKLGNQDMVSGLSKINWHIWNDIFLQTNNLKLNETSSDTLTETSLKQPIKPLPVTLTDTLQTGIYANYNEFVNDKPSIADFNFTIKAPPPYYAGKILLKFRIKDSLQTDKMIKYPLRNIWGFCQYNRVYVRIDRRQFLEIQPLGTSFEIANSSVKVFQPQLTGNDSVVLPQKGFNPPEGAVSSLNPAFLFVGSIFGNPHWRVLVFANGFRIVTIYDLKEI